VGRDGKKSEAILLYRKYDENLIRFMLEKQREKNLKHLSEEELIELSVIEGEELSTMLGYIKAKNKWKYILDCFGDKKAHRIRYFKIAIVFLLVAITTILLVKFLA